MTALALPEGHRMQAVSASPADDAAEILAVRDLALGIVTSEHRLTRIGGLNIKLRPGEMHAVVGPSGCGKTSLCLALIGWTRSNVRMLGGDVRFQGRAILELPPDRLKRLWGRHILYIPQSSATALVPFRRLVDQLTVFPGDDRAARQVRRHDLNDAFRALGVPGFGEDRLPHHFSGGQLQRSLLATAFVTRPRLLVIDEPTTALQPALKTRVMALVKSRLAAIGAAALVVTHELDFFADLVDGLVDLSRHVLPPTDRRAGSDGVMPATSSAPGRFVGSGWRGRPRSSETGASGPASVEVRQLTVTAHHGRPILRDVTFEVSPGTCLALLGSSGAGKTTVLRSILGQHWTASGRILIDGTDLPLHSRHRRRSQKRWIEYVPQSVRSHLNPTLTVGYLLRRRLRQAGRPDTGEVPGEILASLRLPMDCLDKRVDALSGGECQRLGIALALASAPRLLLLDEVTASLDPGTAAAVSDVLEELRDSRRMTMLLVSHQPEMVCRLADATIELRGGHVVGEPSGRQR